MSLITNVGQKIQVSNILAQTLPSTSLFIDSPLQLKDTILFKDPQPMPGDVLTFTGGFWQPGPGGGGGGGITTLNGLVAVNQTLSPGNLGTDFAIISTGSTHKFDLPDASPTPASRGVINTISQTLAGDKTFEDNIIIGVSGNKILWDGGIEIGSTNSVTNNGTAIAIGKIVSATGVSSVAIGWNVTATNNNGINMGYFSSNSGSNAVCIGAQNTATYNTTAIGSFAQPNLPNNSSFGAYSVSRGSYSVTMGRASYTSFQSEYTIALGVMSDASSSNLAQKHSIAIGYDAHAWGDTIAIGRNTDSIRPKTIVIGHGTMATSIYANGDRTITIGAQNVSIGYTNTTIGYNILNETGDSIAIGQNILNTGFSSIRPIIIGNQGSEVGGGNENITIGYKAKTHTASFGSVALGSKVYNRLSTSSIVIGHNAMVGSSVYGCAYNIAIGGNSSVFSVSSSANSSTAIGFEANASGRVDAIALGTGIIANANSGFFVHHNTSMVAGVPARFQAINEIVELVSSARFKDNIIDLEEVDDKFDFLRPIRYRLKGKNENSIGLIAEEVEEIFPEFVTYEEDNSVKIARGIDYELMVSMLIKQTQFLNNKNKFIYNTIETLQKNAIDHDNLLQNIQTEINKRVV